jgi:hypothetical protein
MKRLLRISELSKNEQRVVLIVMLVLIAIALIEYEQRVHRSPVRPTTPVEAKSSPSPGNASDQ